MRFAWCLPALAACFVGFAAGQSPHPTEAQLKAFERFAETSTARVIWSEEAGRIDTDQARAVITALAVEVTGKEKSPDARRANRPDRRRSQGTDLHE